MNMTIDELALMLGAKDMEIYILQRELAAAKKRIEELTPKQEPQLKAVE
jgi:hypothetical protein